MWHASAANQLGTFSVTALFATAEEQLAGVGNAQLGEWREVGDRAVHLRRRLSLEEAALVGPVVDVRGSWEHSKRVNRIRRYLPAAMRDLAAEALP